jgi:hypothetical protein
VVLPDVVLAAERYSQLSRFRRGENTVSADPQRQLLRHLIATLAYRTAKTVRGAPDAFADYQAPGGVKTPVRVLAHMGDLMEWALRMVQGNKEWRETTPLPLEQESERFFGSLKAMDDLLASEAPLQSVERLVQGPIVDAITHAGQLAMLRRQAGSPIRAEAYFISEIAVGRVGADQAPPKREL